MDCIIGYTMTEKVMLNVGSGNFERVSQEPKANPTVADLRCYLCSKARLI